LALPAIVIRLRAYFRDDALARIELMKVQRAKVGESLQIASSNSTAKRKTLFDFLGLLLMGEAKVTANDTLSSLEIKSGEMICRVKLASNFSLPARRVYQKLLKVPPGATVSYKNLAQSVATSPRAVGQVLARNPFPLLIPCHRVISADGSLRGYSAKGGAKSKAILLQAESLMRRQKA